MPHTPRIVVVEDSPESQVILQAALGSYYEVEIVADGEDALKILENNPADLLILDLGLPKRDGFEILALLSANPRFQDLPVMCVTAKKTLTDKVTAFSLGADDYIVKPFDIVEIRARVEAKIRKSVQRRRQSEKLSLGNLLLDVEARRAFLRTGSVEAPLPLTPIEFSLILYFARNAGVVLSREKLLTAVWGNDKEIFDRTVDVHVCSLRRKLGHASNYVASMHGVGYVFNVLQPAERKAA